jgi:hypothetical protein
VSTTGPLADDPLVERLRALHEHYVDAVNRAVAADRYDLVAELVADYPGEALALMAPGPAERRPILPAPMSVYGRPSGVCDRSRATRCRGRAARWASALRAALW